MHKILQAVFHLQGYLLPSRKAASRTARDYRMKRMEEEIMHGESTFRRKKIFIVMIKYLCPVFALIILISSVANAFGWIAM